jgi:hypothetical protein
MWPQASPNRSHDRRGAAPGLFKVLAMEELLELLGEMLVEVIPAMRERRRDRRETAGISPGAVPVQTSSRHIDIGLDAWDHRGRPL